MGVRQGAPPETAAVIGQFALLLDKHISRALGLLRPGMLLSPAQVIVASILHADTPGAETFYRTAEDFFAGQHDSYVVYDTMTEEAIARGIESVDPRLVRTWKLETYLGLLASWEGPATPTATAM